MGTTFAPLPVKLTIGLIARDKDLFEKSRALLAKKFGPIESHSPFYDFNLTDYYKKEMGEALLRQFLSFKKLIPPDRLAEIKIYTNHLEKKLSQRKTARDINIDPGYVSLSKLVLATTKSFVHRIYIARGIYEEVTLFFKDNTFTAGPWTYPDYRCQSHIAFFNEIRKKYYEQIEKTYGISQLSRCV